MRLYYRLEAKFEEVESEEDLPEIELPIPEVVDLPLDHGPEAFYDLSGLAHSDEQLVEQETEAEAEPAEGLVEGSSSSGSGRSRKSPVECEEQEKKEDKEDKEDEEDEEEDKEDEKPTDMEEEEAIPIG